MISPDNWGGGFNNRKDKDFPGGMAFFGSLFDDILLTKFGKNNKKEQKISKKVKKDQKRKRA